MNFPVKYLAAAAALIAAIVGWRAYSAYSAGLDALRANAESYDAVDYGPSPESAAEGETPWRTGKVAVIKRGFGSATGDTSRHPAIIDPSWRRLDAAIRAGSPEEVGTLILTTAGARVESHQEGRKFVTLAPVPQVELRVFDMRKKILIGSAAVEADPKGDYGRAVAAFIKSMPAR